MRAKRPTCDKRVLTKTDAAEYLGVSRRTIHSWKKSGFGPRFFPTPGGREYTTREECDRLLSSLEGGAE